MQIIRTITILLLALLVQEGSSSSLACQQYFLYWSKQIKHHLSEREGLVNTIYGVQLILDNMDKGKSEVIGNTGTYQSQNMMNAGRFIRKGDKVLVIGAHIGLQAVAFGDLIGKQGQLFAIEPYHQSFEILTKNIYLHKLEEVTQLYNIFPGNKKGKGELMLNKNDTYKYSIASDEDANKFKQNFEVNEKVDINKVDDILPIDARLDFVFIALESGVVQALEGMKQAVLRSPGIIIFWRFNGAWKDKKAQRKVEYMLEWFKYRQYRLYKVAGRKDDYTKTTGCGRESFAQLSVQQMMELGRKLGQRSIYIMITASHIDPNYMT